MWVVKNKVSGDEQLLDLPRDTTKQTVLNYSSVLYSTFSDISIEYRPAAVM